MGKTLYQRFEDKIVRIPIAGCWIWTGCVNEFGYGKMGVDGKTKKAHRVSYELHVGPIPDGMIVMHRCDTPGCVCPHHLSVGTFKANSDDRDSKGRQALYMLPGERHWNAKLTTDKVALIKSMLSSGRTGVEIASAFGVSNRTVSKIKSGKRWAHI